MKCKQWIAAVLCLLMLAAVVLAQLPDKKEETVD